MAAAALALKEITVMALAEEDIPLPAVLAGRWTRESITALARQKRAVQRSRKKDIWILLWVLLFGFAAGSRRTLVGLWEAYNQYAKEPVSSSTFQGWLSDNMATFLKVLVQQTLNESRPALTIQGHILDRLTELLAIDSTVLNLHRFLREHFKATSKTGAAAKLHVAINLLAAKIERVKLT